MKHLFLALIFLSLRVSLCGEDSFWNGKDNFWRDEKGNPTANTESRSGVNGFGGWLLATTDTDWRAKWETSSNTVPHFTEATTVGKGTHVFVLIFFSNPKLSDTRAANVTCDIDVTRLDGSSSVHQPNAVCFQGELKGRPSNMYLSAPILDVILYPGDPAGEWLVRVTLKDNVRHVSLPLKKSFTLQ